jgi:hypothetical protein
MKTSTVIVSLIFTFLILTSSPVPVNAQNSGEYIIERISRRFEIKYGGYIFIYDTITIKGSSNTTLESFIFGFPYEYRTNILDCYAYNFSNSKEIIKSSFTSEIKKLGFCWMKVTFPTAIKLQDGESYNFTVLSILENVISATKEKDTWRYTLTLPPYPSLTMRVTKFEASIFLPLKTNYTRMEFEKFAETKIEEYNTTANTVIKYSQEGLEEFFYKPKKESHISFIVVDPIQIIVLNELDKEIRFDEAGNIYVSDSYYITSKSIEEIESIKLALPWNASEITVWDEFGKPTLKPTVINIEKNIYRIKIEPPIQTNESVRFKVSYTLPADEYLMRNGLEDFSFNLTLFENMNLLISDFSLKIILPEGAEIIYLETSNLNYSVIQKKVFADSVVYLSEDMVIPLTQIKVQLQYRYNILWSSFRPTLWIGTAVALAFMVAFLWQRQKLKPAVVMPSIKISPEDLKSFIDAYEEKRRINSELEILEVKVHKGKIPRRRYKIRRRTLESRVSSLNKRIAELKEQIRSAGARYADAIGQLEVAETELETVEVDIKRIEARYRRGEVSRSAYRKLLEEYRKRKEKALITIDGVLIRFREEIR